MIGFYLPHRRDGERIILLLHRHPFVIFVRLGFWLLVGLLPIGLYTMLANSELLANVTNNNILSAVAILIMSAYYLTTWLLIFYSFIDYYLDVWIITTHRIVSIDQSGLFNRVVSEQELYRVQDVTADVKGVFPTLLNYGDVNIQTAAEQERFTFEQVPSPYRIVKQITALVEENKKSHHIMMEEAANEAAHNQ